MYSRECSINLLQSRVLQHLIFEVFTVVKMQVEVSWVVMLCKYCGRIPTFERTLLSPSTGWSQWCYENGHITSSKGGSSSSSKTLVSWHTLCSITTQNTEICIYSLVPHCLWLLESLPNFFYINLHLLLHHIHFHIIKSLPSQDSK